LTATLPGQRQAAINTQAASMSDKFDSLQQTWDNSKPSDAYQAPMPGISQEAQKARAALDPRYAQRLQQQNGQNGQNITVKTSDGKMGWNGTQWVTLAGK
jgi:hypothetical protein